MGAIWMVVIAMLLGAACMGQGATEAPGGAAGTVTPEPTAEARDKTVSGSDDPLPTPEPTASPQDKTVSGSDPSPTPEPTSIVPSDMVEVPAPIESVEIIIAESYPPQYFVHVVSGLPNGCVEFYGYEESRSGNAVTITVTNLEPAPSEPIACAAIYLTHETSVPLGTDFQPGETYTVKVNEAVETFVAQ